jgi:hypothetical protein
MSKVQWVVIACEKYGRVRDAILRKHPDWKVFSCDLQPTVVPGPHIIGNIIDHLDDGWDMMIAFPPCTHLARSGAKWFSPKSAYFRPEKVRLQKKAVRFTKKLWRAKIEKIGLENPVGVLSTQFMEPTQIVGPNWFGDRAQKMTCLWLKNLPLLVPTDFIEITDDDWFYYPSGKRLPKWYANLPKKSRSETRGISWPGMAKAMAEQWT